MLTAPSEDARSLEWFAWWLVTLSAVESTHTGFGVFVFCLFSGGSTPFSKKYCGMESKDEATLEWKIELPKKISGQEGKKPFPGGSGDLIEKLLDRDTSTRMTMRGSALQEHRFFQKQSWVKVALETTKVQWVPEPGMLYVPPQDLIKKRDHDADYEHIKLDPSQSIDMQFVNSADHEKFIVEVIKLDRSGELSHLPGGPAEHKSSACAVQ